MASWALRFSKPLVRDPLLFDLSRLLSRAHRTTPTGIDRVELAWAQHLIEFAPERLVFTAINAFGRIGILSTSPAVLFVAAVARVWSGAPAPHAADEPVALALRLQVALAVGGDRAIARRVAAMGGRSTYILVSHHHLEKSESIHRLLTQTGARFLTLVHDVIPLALPEYARKGTPQVHLRRIETVARSADVVVTNSVGTSDALKPYFDRARRWPEVIVSALGVDKPSGEPVLGRPGKQPYFVCISTIEPRKNHVLLLNVWRRIVHEGGPIPHLHLVGRRGWNNHAYIELLKQSPALASHVTEHSKASDQQVAALLTHARALLLPSFAEGYGLPVAEALACGTPVICSELSTLREVGGAAPDYIDPFDGLAWLQAVRDYTESTSKRRAAQLVRLKTWRPPLWSDHFARIEPQLGIERPVGKI